MRLDDTPPWYVPQSDLGNVARPFAGKVVINPQLMARASNRLNSISSELPASFSSPPSLPPEYSGLAADLESIATRLRTVGHELRSSASVLSKRAQFAHAGQALPWDAPTDELAAEDIRMEEAKEIVADMEQRGFNDLEKAIVLDLLRQGMTRYQYEELLRGGHVLVEGRGLYEKWQDLPGVYERSHSSSHYRDPVKHRPDGPKWGNQYGIGTNMLGAVLFGPGPDGSTFIQLEGHEVGMPENLRDLDETSLVSRTEFGLHMVDYGLYKLDPDQKNRGPHGTSFHNDSKPLIIGRVDVPKPTVWQLNAEFDRLVKKAQRAYDKDHPTQPTIHPGVAPVPVIPLQSEETLLAEGYLDQSRDQFTADGR